VIGVVERILWIACTAALTPLNSTRAMLEIFVAVADVTEEMSLIFASKQRNRDTMDRCIPPPFIIETSLRFQEIKEPRVRFAAPEVHIAYFKVTPVVTHVVSVTSVVGEEVHRILGVQEMWVFGHEFLH